MLYVKLLRRCNCYLDCQLYIFEGNGAWSIISPGTMHYHSVFSSIFTKRFHFVYKFTFFLMEVKYVFNYHHMKELGIIYFIESLFLNWNFGKYYDLPKTIFFIQGLVKKNWQFDGTLKERNSQFISLSVYLQNEKTIAYQFRQ